MQLLFPFPIWIAVLAMSGCRTASIPCYLEHGTVAKPEARTEAVLQSLPPTSEDAGQDQRIEELSLREIATTSYVAVETENALEEGLFIESLSPQDRSVQQPSLANNLLNDHLNFYSPESLIPLSGGLAIGATLANTNLDRKLHEQFQRDFRGDDTDETYEFLHANKEWGNGWYTLPVFATAWAAGKLFDNSPTAAWSGEWGERSFRSFLVGAPPMLVFQQATGASRPGETYNDSRWHPFHDNNGVSGHSFMGALPFINAAKITDDPWIKATFYAGSTLAPLSRVNDDAHYPSQAVLGWWFAYLAATSIDQTQNAEQPWQFHPRISDRQSGCEIEYQF